MSLLLELHALKIIIAIMNQVFKNIETGEVTFLFTTKLLRELHTHKIIIAIYKSVLGKIYRIETGEVSDFFFALNTRDLLMLPLFELHVLKEWLPI